MALATRSLMASTFGDVWARARFRAFGGIKGGISSSSMVDGELFVNSGSGLRGKWKDMAEKLRWCSRGRESFVDLSEAVKSEVDADLLWSANSLGGGMGGGDESSSSSAIFAAISGVLGVRDTDFFFDSFSVRSGSYTGAGD